MMSPIFQIPDVGWRGTGLLIPPQRETAFKLYADAGPMFTRAEIEEVLSDPRRVPRVKLFGSEWIYNQGSVGSCNGFAAAQAVERTRYFRGLPKVKLSGVGLYAMINGGRDQGSMLDDGMEAIQIYGVPPDSMVPEGQWRRDRIDPKAFTEAINYRAFECYGIDTEDELASASAAGFTCVVAVHAGNAGLDSNGVVQWGGGPGNHAVTVDDLRIRAGQFEFDMPNSWGTTWGRGGRAWLQWGRHLASTIRNHYFYAIRSAVDPTHDRARGEFLCALNPVSVSA